MTHTSSITILFIWKQSYYNLPRNGMNNFWGFADMLWGTLSTYQLCKKLNYNFIVDFSLHPISQFFKNTSSLTINQLKQVEATTTFIAHNNIESFIQSQIKTSNNNFVSLATNTRTYNITLDDRIWFENTFQPLLPLQSSINSILEKLPPNFITKHIRLGDNYLINNQDQSNLFQQILNNFILSLSNINTAIFVCVDSPKFKDFLLNNTSSSNIILTNHHPTHLGISTNNDQILYTLAEFFVMCRSSFIYSYKGSGFSALPHYIYNIPYHQLS